jgi:hypothetical protein
MKAIWRAVDNMVVGPILSQSPQEVRRKIRIGEHVDDTNSECFAYPLER